MHELSVTKDILETVLNIAEANGATRVASVSLTVGEMRDIVPELMQRYFAYVCEGTIAEGATLEIQSIPVTLKCKQCEHVFPCDMRQAAEITCPACGKRGFDMATGRELRIEGIQIQ